MDETGNHGGSEPVPMEAKKTSHESLFGFLVVMIIVVVLVLLASYGGWFLYRGIQKNMDEADRLSIADIPQGASDETGDIPQPIVQAEGLNAAPSAASASAPINKKVVVRVLNGGGVKGSAGTVAGVITAAGYTSVTTGNSVGDYTGMTIYYMAPATEAEANAVRDALITKYPSSTVKPSIPGNKDTWVAPVTVIVGK